MSAWQTRKRVEVGAKLESLVNDLERWRSRSTAGQDLEKHHSQVLRLQRDFEPVAGLLARDAGDASVADRWRTVERAVQDLLSVWGYFRDKLAVRLVPEYAGYLAAADDLAWACYRPAQQAAIAAGTVEVTVVREPPLACLDDVGSPYSLLRGTSYAGELAGGQQLVGSSQTLLRSLPVPVIAVPWFQLEHLPDALVIAHEVGHHVVRDLDLEQASMDVVGGAAFETYRPTWGTEVFCDVYGVLNAGSAFVAALSDFLRVSVVTDDATDLYPPTVTRLAICLAVLELDEVGCHQAAGRLRQRWAAEGLNVPASAEADAVAAGMTRTHFDGLGGRLLDVLGFGAHKETRTTGEATELLAHRPVKTKDVRVLFAAAAVAFAENPRRYHEVGVGPAVLERARAIREPGVRWRSGHGSANGRAVLESEPAGIYRLLTGQGQQDQ